MENNYNDIGDDEIRVLGGSKEKEESYKGDGRSPGKILRFIKPFSWVGLTSYVAVLIVVLFVILWCFNGLHKSQKALEASDTLDPGCLEEELGISIQRPAVKLPLSRAEDIGHGFIEIVDTIINDIPLRLYIPHQVIWSLHLGAIDRNDSSIIFTTQAADVRADNGGIVGAFVLEGEPKAWGQSKKGFCAIINDTVTVGVADNSPLFEEATEKEGYFFRQFPLVDNGQLVENEQRGKSIRRALCDRNRELFTVESLTAESLHDFAQALADMGIDQAIYLVGSNAYGWATDDEGYRHEFGILDPTQKKWKSINYLVMRDKN